MFYLPIDIIKKNPLTAPSAILSQRGGCEGMALNTVAMLLDPAHNPTMMVFIFFWSLFLDKVDK